MEFKYLIAERLLQPRGFPQSLQINAGLVHWQQSLSSTPFQIKYSPIIIVVESNGSVVAKNNKWTGDPASVIKVSILLLFKCPFTFYSFTAINILTYHRNIKPNKCAYLSLNQCTEV